MQKVPIYIVTGFLGSGKTTLLRHIISSHDQDAKIAIIQNDFSDEMGIEAPTMQDKDGNLFKEFFELPNGCVCCTVKDELLKATEHLLSMKRFEKILLETTGIADPEPIIEKFWLDCELESSVELSGVITVIDTYNFKNYIDLELINKRVGCESNNSLFENNNHQRSQESSQNSSSLKLLSPEIIKQIMLANKIILNKTDLLFENGSENNSDNLQKLTEVEAIIRAINPIANVITAIKSQVKMDWLFDLDAFNIHKITHEIDRALNNSLISSHSNNSILPNISSCTISFNSNTTFDLKSVERTIAKLAWEEEDSLENEDLEEQNPEHLKYDSVNSKYGKLIRFKGIFKTRNFFESDHLSNSTTIYALQGVGQIFEILPIKINEQVESSKFFFLGIKLDKDKLGTLLKSCIIR
ncbi:nitrile hydratase activator like P-loop ATpase [Cryptosporidium sp. chipmunk genotype I]|uniref:nitrile hydratase activator like P-loop ATpase n=1 Tax=Cryptosporidium sp. chipmunk genotype I TaxID=1280935 RepID=UPI00351AA152|nr:nitrile hydratase activator like P-loop ATpase [Cryptosporidium sp. chipmunk genotype I]